jgi:hypothetical protein
MAWGTCLGTVPAGGPSLRGFVHSSRSVPRFPASEIAVPAAESDDAVLGRPVALAFGGGRLYVVDALDCAVKIFAKNGRFLGSFGGKGQGPGQLSFPSGVCVAGNLTAVADKLNFRIQLFDDQGRSRGGFKLPFAPDRVIALGAGRLLITVNPTGRLPDERLLHVYETDGRRVWDGLETQASSDPVSAVFRNMILVCPGQSGDFYVLFRCGDRTVLHYSDSGALMDPIAVDERYASMPVVLPIGRGGLRLSGFCWAAAFDRGLLYMSAPQPLSGMDLGPGRSIAKVDEAGRLRSVIDLPCAIHRFLVADGYLFAIDGEDELRIFEVPR